MVIDELSPIEISRLQHDADRSNDTVEVEAEQLRTLLEAYRSNVARGCEVRVLQRKLEDAYRERRYDEDLIDMLRRDLREANKHINSTRQPVEAP